MNEKKALISAFTLGIITGISLAIVFDNIVIGGGLGIVFGFAMYLAEKPKPPKDK